MKRECDVVIIGAGLAGLTAALFAVKRGLTAVVVEKTDFIGGCSCWSYGATWIGGNDQAADAGIPDNIHDVETYLTFMGGGANEEGRTRTLIEQAPATIAALRDWGVPLDLMRGVNDVMFGKAPGAVTEGRTMEPPIAQGAMLGDWRSRLNVPPGDEWRVPKSVIARITDPALAAPTIASAVERDQLAQGASLIAHLMCALRDLGADVRTGQEAEELLCENGRVAGVRTASQDEWRARLGVLVATGSYLGNAALVATLDDLAGYRAWCPVGSTGDGLQLATAIGAKVKVTRNNLAIMLGYNDPDDPHALNVGAPSVRELPRAHTMVVNRKGERFGNEGAFQELALALRIFDMKTRTLANLPCWMIFDAQYAVKWGFAGSAPGKVPEWVEQADTLSDLALKLGIDPVGLTTTAERLSGFAALGDDADYGKKPGWAMTPGSGGGINPNLGSISQAPFYGTRLFPTLGVGGGGIKADPKARVADWKDEIIPGLYAAGDVAVHDEFGTGYQAGLTFASAMTFAMVAIDDMRETANAVR